MSLSRKRLLNTSVLVGVSALGLTIASAAFAQEPEATDVDEVVVTGSRIARPNQDSPTAVTVVTAQVVESTGETNLGEILRTLPAAGVSALTPTTTTFTTQGNGQATINLRNLGEDRTLVLVNGRRFVAGLPGSQIVDFNTLPTEIVDRIDVVTGGASAVYGSDALAGVINIITDKNYEGFDIFGQAGISERGDNERVKVGVRFGSNFADDRGNFAGALSYTSTGAVYARNRADRQMHRDGLGGLFGTGTGTFGETNFFFPSSFTPAGVAVVPGIGAGGILRVFRPATNTSSGYAAATDGFNRQAIRQLYVPNDALAFNGAMNYDFNENHRFFLEATTFYGETNSNIEPSPINGGNIFVDAIGTPLAPVCTIAGCQFGIPLTSAIVPESIRQDVRNRTVGLTDEQRVVGFQRRMSEVGNRQNTASRQLFRFVTGMEGDLNENTRYEFSLNYGRSSEQQLTNGGVNSARLFQTLDVIDTGGGNLQCRDVNARAQGCRPFFIFQEGGASQAVVDYIKIQNSFDAFVEQQIANGFITGDFGGFELPGGPVEYVLGGEYRRESSRNTPDPTLQNGTASGNIAPETKGSFDVYEAFAELRLPILRDMPLAHSLDLNLAARLSEYSTVGQTEAYAVSLEYMPTDWLKLRGQYATAVRAPNITELFAGRAQTFPANLDPCRGLTTSGGQAAFRTIRQDNANPANVGASPVNAATIGSDNARACLADPTLAARVARDGTFAQTQAEAQGTGGFNSGNQNLRAEDSVSITYGLLFNADWNDWISPFSLSVDYFNIEIEGIIANLARATSLNECYINSGGIYDATSPYCQSIIRFDTASPNVGAMAQLNSQTQNLGEFETSGIDVQASYTFDFGTMPMTRGFGGDLGTLTASLIYQHLLTYKQSPIAGAPLVEFAGLTGLSENKATLDLVYRRNDLTISWQTLFVGENCFFALDDCADDAFSGYIPLTTFSDAQVRYNLSDRATVYAGVDNIFDEYVFIGSNYGGEVPTGWTTAPAVFDGVGRRFYVGARLRF